MLGEHGKIDVNVYIGDGDNCHEFNGFTVEDMVKDIVEMHEVPSDPPYIKPDSMKEIRIILGHFKEDVYNAVDAAVLDAQSRVKT